MLSQDEMAPSGTADQARYPSGKTAYSYILEHEKFKELLMPQEAS
jgi:hypothetical protein